MRAKGKRSSTSFRFPLFDYLKQAAACLVLPFFAVCLAAVVFLLVVYRWLLCVTRPWLRPDLSNKARYMCNVLMTSETLGLPDYNWNIVLRLKLKGPVNLEATRAHFQRQFVDVNPESKAHLKRWGGYWFWKPEADFQINRHVLEHKTRVRPEEVSQLQVEWQNEALPAQMSPWQILLCEEQPPIGACGDAPSHYLLFKFHHALCDGYAILRALIHCTDEAGEITSLHAGVGGSDPSSVPASAQKAKLASFFEMVRFPFLYVLEVARLACLPRQRMPWSTRPGRKKPAFADRRCYHAISERRVSVERVKHTSRRQGVSFTAFMLAAWTGGVRKYMAERFGEEQVPEEVTMPCPIPLPDHPPGLCNSIWSITLRLPTGCPDRQARVRRIDAMLKERKSSVEPAVTWLLVRIVGLLPASWIEWPVMVGVGISNFPVPGTPLRINGRLLEDLNVTMSTLIADLYTVFISYNGQIAFTCVGEQSLFDGVDGLARVGECIAEEFEELRKLGA